ncbi:hypothetical protein PEG80_00440, partial [Lactococcus lactis]|nr:hypothetical protein [Lactococcus lactis]
VEEVVKLWNDKESIQEKNQEKEISILVEDWQIEKETENFLYVTIDTALDKEATIKIPARCVDKLENGDYQVFIKNKDRFSYLDKKSPANHKIMYGTTVAKNLQRQSGNGCNRTCNFIKIYKSRNINILRLYHRHIINVI